MAEAQRGLGRPAEALATAEAALEIARELGNKVFEGRHLIAYARIQRANNLHAGALTSYQQSASLHRNLGDRNEEAAALDGAGEAYRETGQPELAVAFHRQAAAMFRDSGNRWMLAVALGNLADALKLTGDTPAAAGAWRELLPLITEFPDQQAITLRARVERELDALPGLPGSRDRPRVHPRTGATFMADEITIAIAIAIAAAGKARRCPTTPGRPCGIDRD
jgi:tetratricopeptide (TPR) repeat protein